MNREMATQILNEWIAGITDDDIEDDVYLEDLRDALNFAVSDMDTLQEILDITSCVCED